MATEHIHTRGPGDTEWHPCERCLTQGADRERERLRMPIIEFVATAILSLPNGGGRSANEARRVGMHVADLVLAYPDPTV